MTLRTTGGEITVFCHIAIDELPHFYSGPSLTQWVTKEKHEKEAFLVALVEWELDTKRGCVDEVRVMMKREISVIRKYFTQVSNC